MAEELQMVDISLLFRKAETSFFINLHNALMLHTHYYRWYTPFARIFCAPYKLLRVSCALCLNFMRISALRMRRAKS